jgi:hypothetical protein
MAILRGSMTAYDKHKVAREKREKHIAGDVEGLLDKTPLVLKSTTKKLFAPSVCLHRSFLP